MAEVELVESEMAETNTARGKDGRSRGQILTDVQILTWI